MRLKLDGFIGCCGIQIIHNLGNNSNVNPPVSVRDMDKDLSDILLKGVRGVNGAYPTIKPFNHAMQLIALNTCQHKKFHKMLIGKGFKLIDEGWNSNHRNMNYLYSLHLEEGRKTYKLK